MACTSLTFKLIVGGEGGVGKTTLLRKYVTKQFDFDAKMTIGVDIMKKELQLPTGQICWLQLWDFGGQDRFRFFLDSFVMGASGAFLMFDLTRLTSFEKLDEWLSILRKYDATLPVILIGTKFDLTEDIIISDALPLDYIENHNIKQYVKVSSKTGYNVEDVFNLLVNQIIEYKSLGNKLVKNQIGTPF